MSACCSHPPASHTGNDEMQFPARKGDWFEGDRLPLAAHGPTPNVAGADGGAPPPPATAALSKAAAAVTPPVAPGAGWVSFAFSLAQKIRKGPLREQVEQQGSGDWVELFHSLSQAASDFTWRVIDKHEWLLHLTSFVSATHSLLHEAVSAEYAQHLQDKAGSVRASLDAKLPGPAWESLGALLRCAGKSARRLSCRPCGWTRLGNLC